ncbi:cytochrome c biogenesis CcdA family protein [Nocardiopsis alba]|uniref:Cytochrome c biogenesis protein CcdA n=1 Tax=Nocardiopsis alba TaxID=53437 RepID=A0A7K2INY1_9ACTN|nr:MULTISPECIES: cytochrome c biogenesis CcdA family protein [Nocardiopsis]MEC3894077.1 cytochrome c biogenesis CcdA family protein [Nocardiopsis sp. LDBS1602]MYR31691.1 cytochrome c biogenesis protein CcdA [Nocardiopsis alba]
MDIGLLAATAGGVLALFSPCSALLLPSFFAYAFRNPGHLLLHTGIFYIGLCLTLIPLGAGSAMVSVLFYGHRETLIGIAGGVIIAFGIIQILGWGYTWGPLARAQSRFASGRGRLSVLGLGAVYGLAGFCSGPILGAVLTVAATGTPARGMLLMAAYALGMVLPMFLLALGWDRFDLGRRRWLRGRSLRVGPLTTHTTAVLSGALFIGVGVIFLVFDGTASMSGLPGMRWLEEVAYRAQEPLSRLGSTTDVIALVLVAVLLGALALFARRGGASASDDARTTDRDPSARETSEGE